MHVDTPNIRSRHAVVCCAAQEAGAPQLPFYITVIVLHT